MSRGSRRSFGKSSKGAQMTMGGQCHLGFEGMWHW